MQVRGRALKKEEQEQVDIAQKVLDVLKDGKDLRWVPYYACRLAP
jgi:hypothetical protein